ncbi:MAG: hypothetical protein FWH35_07685, partial [Treponema sp.]|nr:hypothetical protein [Treponema sp.]
MVRRVYIGKKDGFDVKARQLKIDIAGLFGGRLPDIKELKSLKILRRYDVDLLEEEQFKQAVYSVLSDPRSDLVYFSKEPPVKETESFFGVE